MYSPSSTPGRTAAQCALVKRIGQLFGEPSSLKPCVLGGTLFSSGILKIMARHNIPTLDAFDEWFGGTQSVFNWVQDFEMELDNAGSWLFRIRKDF